MSKTEAVLAANREAGRPSLVGYFPMGFPSTEASIEAAIAMCENGVDVLELGVPYSDPVMDGPVIQEATLQALENGFKLKHVFEVVRAVTSRVNTPILVMTYWNPVVQYGVERFAADLAAAGGAGLITPDLIPDEAREWQEAAERFGLDRVYLAAPTSTPARVASACAASQGFVYAVSTMGITGARNELDANARAVTAAIRSADPDAFACVGIGISTAAQVQEVNTYADGAIVGSAFVNAYLHAGLPALVAKVKELAGRV